MFLYPYEFILQKMLENFRELFLISLQSEEVFGFTPFYGIAQKKVEVNDRNKWSLSTSSISL
jgi:hypothetical protein